MRLHISKFILVSFIGLIIGQNQSPYLDIANELLVRKKLAKKLPDYFQGQFPIHLYFFEIRHGLE